MLENDDRTRGLYLESLVSRVSGWDDPERRLREAFAQDEFMLLGQSIVPLDGARQLPFRLELLVRLREEEINLAPPGTFFPVLEACGMLPMLDRWVIEHVARWWQGRNGVLNTVLDINLAADTLADGDFPAFVESRLRDAGMPASAMCFEVPAQDITTAPAPALQSIARLKAIGCEIAVTGFGLDAISLEALRTTGARVVKIDGAIVRAVHEEAAAFAKVRSIQRLCETAGVLTVAEFVERPDTVSRLREAGIHYVQGYGIAKPEPLPAAGRAQDRSLLPGKPSARVPPAAGMRAHVQA